MVCPDLSGQNHAAKKVGMEKLPELPANPGSVKSALCKWRGSHPDTEMRLLQPAPVEVADRSEQV